MKSLVSVLGSFMFCIFSEGFIRVIITFYHKGEFIFFGMNGLPSQKWIYIIFGSTLLIYWLSGMMILTINNLKVKKHLFFFGLILILWRINEIIQTSFQEPLWYYFVAFLLIPVSLYLCYLTHAKSISQNNT